MKTRTLDCDELDCFRLGTAIDPARAVWSGREGRLYVAIRKKVASFEIVDGTLRRLGDMESFKDSILFLALSEDGRLLAVTASKPAAALHEVQGRRNPLLSYPHPALCSSRDPATRRLDPSRNVRKLLQPCMCSTLSSGKRLAHCRCPTEKPVCKLEETIGSSCAAAGAKSAWSISLAFSHAAARALSRAGSSAPRA